MTLLNKNGGYTFLIWSNLMFSLSLWKEFQLLQILNDLSIKHLIKLTLYQNDAKLLKFKRVLSVRYWLLIPEMNASRKAMKWLSCFFIVRICLFFNVGMPIV